MPFTRRLAASERALSGEGRGMAEMRTGRRVRM